MPESKKSKNRKARKEKAIKQAKRKKIIIIAIIAVVIVALAIIIALFYSRQKGTETYSSGGQTITLHNDGTFTANLAHGLSYEGSYEKTSDSDGTILIFTTGGTSVSGRVNGDILSIPDEWLDDHGHGSELKKQ